MEEDEKYHKNLLDSHSHGYEMSEIERAPSLGPWPWQEEDLPEVFKIGGCKPRQ